MTRPLRDEYIDSSHTNPGEIGGIRPAVLPPIPLGIADPKRDGMTCGTRFVQSHRQTFSVEPQSDQPSDDAVCLWVMRRALLSLVVILAILATVCIVWQLTKAAQ